MKIKLSDGEKERRQRSPSVKLHQVYKRIFLDTKKRM